MPYACPNCRCYKLEAPLIEGFYDYSYAKCYNQEGFWVIQYFSETMVAGQVIIVCAVPGSISTDLGVNITDLFTECVLSTPCETPQGFCYTITLETGSVVTFRYITPNNGSYLDITQYGSVSSMLGTETNICAWPGTIVITGGDGTINISPAGTACELTQVCQANCICVTLTNDDPINTLYYNYYDCTTRSLVGYQSLASGNSASFCMLDYGFDAYGASYVNTINGPCIGECVPPAFPQRCTFNFTQYPYPQVPQMMDSLILDPTWSDTFTLLDYTVNGIQYASGQILTVGFGGDPVLFGLGQDGLTYPMNVNDWMNAIGAPGMAFYDNMRVIDCMSDTVFTIHIQKGGINYYFTSAFGFGINTQSSTYGTRTCIPYAP